MSTQADVKSIDTLAFVKEALIAYAHESGQALSDLEIEGQRGVDWITGEQATFWKAEVRRSADAVNQAVKDLEYCRAFKKVGDNQPSCAEEKKALEKARKRLARAEEKLELVRRWTPVVLQQFREACVRLVRFREVIDVHCPRATAQLDRKLRALDEYRSVSSPSRRGAASGISAGEASVSRGTAAEDGTGTDARPAGTDAAGEEGEA